MTTPTPALSPRQWQILALLAEGRPNKEIAQHLDIAVHTVEKHLTHLYAKIAVHNRASAIQWYWQHKHTGTIPEIRY